MPWSIQKDMGCMRNKAEIEVITLGFSWTSPTGLWFDYYSLRPNKDYLLTSLSQPTLNHYYRSLMGEKSESVSCSVVFNSLKLHGLSPTRLLYPCNSPVKNTEVFAIPFFRGSSWPRDWTWISCIAGRFFTVWATREAHLSHQGSPPKPQLHCYFLPQPLHHFVLHQGLMLYRSFGAFSFSPFVKKS